MARDDTCRPTTLGLGLPLLSSSEAQVRPSYPLYHYSIGKTGPVKPELSSTKPKTTQPPLSIIYRNRLRLFYRRPYPEVKKGG